MSDDEEKKLGDVRPLKTEQEDPVFKMADQLTKLIAAAPANMTQTQIVAAIKLATDAYGHILVKSLGQDEANKVFLDAMTIRRTYGFTSEWLDHVDAQRRETQQKIEERDAEKPRAKVIPFKRKDETS